MNLSSKIIIGLALFINGLAQAQTGKGYVPIHTKDQNQKWLWELEMLPLKEQVTKIQERILMDSCLSVSTTKLTIGSYTEGNMPQYMIDNIILAIHKETTKDELIELNNIIDKVISVKIMDQAQGASYVGSKAAGGVVWLETNDKKNVQKKLQELKIASQL